MDNELTLAIAKLLRSSVRRDATIDAIFSWAMGLPPGTPWGANHGSTMEEMMETGWKLDEL
jgi:hypothetical protein